MPLMEHIRELRNRVIKMALALIVGMAVGWFLYPHVWHFIEAPYCRADFATHLPGEANGPNNCHLYVTGIFDAFFLRLKISFIVGVILSSPVWLYQLWAFIAPGLYARERRWAYYFVGAAVPLFGLGAMFAYFAMTRGLEFLLGLVPGNVTPLITITTYLSYAMAMLLIFGLAFELPLVLVMLNLAGLDPGGDRRGVHLAERPAPGPPAGGGLRRPARRAVPDRPGRGRRGPERQLPLIKPASQLAQRPA
jgi:sec-independent protein translocase protein TatC